MLANYSPAAQPATCFALVCCGGGGHFAESSMFLQANEVNLLSLFASEANFGTEHNNNGRKLIINIIVVETDAHLSVWLAGRWAART